ncbi:hypothetical protein Cgig2_020003 [Carnegiea gigantea]|uniref:Uncharacterized protein n=1 Tax=Carnegiea gigantea TaxID=171969 RepID=A0A9Q1KCH8_9CARY|nr:hypothetical protein Cgig2_020003 [Carnegiea gigantea]
MIINWLNTRKILLKFAVYVLKVRCGSNHDDHCPIVARYDSSGLKMLAANRMYGNQLQIQPDQDRILHDTAYPSCSLDKLTLMIMARNLKKAGREELTASVKRDFEEYVDDREESLEELPSSTIFPTAEGKERRACWGTPDYDQLRKPPFAEHHPSHFVVLAFIRDDLPPHPLGQGPSKTVTILALHVVGEGNPNPRSCCESPNKAVRWTNKGSNSRQVHGTRWLREAHEGLSNKN